MSEKYAKEREQFGGPIANFQIIQHKLVDMLVALEGARLITYEAAWKISRRLTADFEVAAAKAWSGNSFEKVANQAMRIFSGLGSRKDYDIQLYYRRIKPLKMFLGDPFFWQQKIASLAGL